MERRAGVGLYPGVTERHLCPKIVSVTYRTRSQFPVIGRALCAGEATIDETVTLLESILGLNRLLDADQFDVEVALAFLNTPALRSIPRLTRQSNMHANVWRLPRAATTSTKQ
jgi:hypothetical protein